jgi:hypothetical protein
MEKAAKTSRERHTFFQREYELQLEMGRPCKQLLEVPAVRPGYLLRQFRPGDEQEYDALFHLAFEDRGRFPEILERTLPGGFFVVEDLTSRELVSSCLAMRGGSSPRHRDAGQSGWLVTDPAHTGKGLGELSWPRLRRTDSRSKVTTDRSVGRKIRGPRLFLFM